MRYIIGLILIAGGLKSQYLWQFSSDTITKWNYQGGDEFNGGKVNTDKWIIGFPWSRSMFINDNYVLNDNFIFKDGKANFIVKELDSTITLQSFEFDSVSLKKDKIKLETGNRYLFKHSTALLWSKKSYRYGYFEIKFKGVEGKGVWPAFWLYGGNPNYEIDFFELKGELESKIHVDIHCPSGCSDFKKNLLSQGKGWGHWIKANEKLKSGYNIISGEWGANYIKWYLNGSLIAYSDICIEIPMSLVVGTGVAKDNGPFRPGPDKNTPFPNYFIVDYIRVFKSDTIPNIKTIKGNVFENTDSKEVTTTYFKTRTSKSKIKFLPRGVKQGIKDKNAITISIIQQTKNSLSIRVLGASQSNTAKLTFLNPENGLIEERIYTGSEENIFLFDRNQVLKVQIEANNKITKEIITLE